MADEAYDGGRVDFLDGTVFTADEAYLTLGTWADAAPYTSDYTGSDIYYRSIQSREVDYLTVRDYLWRWDTDWFWCSRAFGAQNPRIRRFWPKRWLRSDVYWKTDPPGEPLPRGRAPRAQRKGLPPRERVVQDVEIPLARTAEFLGWFLKEVPIEPVWLCPIQLRDSGATAAVCAGLRQRALAALSAAGGSALCQRRLLVDRRDHRGRAGRRREPAHRGRRHRA